jgi:hypothetical protein
MEQDKTTAAASPSRPSWRVRCRRALFKGLLLCISALVGLAILEGGVRVFLPVYIPYGMVPFHVDANNVPLAPKNFTARYRKTTRQYDTILIQINQYGLRDAKDLCDSTENDLFVVGDSYSYGWGVEEDQRYSDLLASMLGVDVYNISIPTDIDGYIRLVEYARRQGATINSLVVGICMENDLRDYAVPIPAVRREGILARAKQYLNQHTATYNAITSAVHQSAFLAGVAVKLGVINDGSSAARPMYSRRVIESSAEKVDELVERFGIPTVVVIVPVRGLWIGGAEDDYSRIHEEFVALLRERSLSVVDMRPVFEAGGDPLGYYFGHWTTEGHAKAAEEIYKVMRASEPQDAIAGTGPQR